jgi:hypothetical protein
VGRGVERGCEGEIVSVRVFYQVRSYGVQGDGSTALENCPLPGVEGSVDP